MGKTTTTAPEAAAATGATITPEPTANTVIEVNSDGVNQLLSDKDDRIADLESDLALANEKVSDLTTALEAALDKLDVYTEKEADKILFTSDNGKIYHITVPSFRFKGNEYQSAEAITEHPDVLEELIEAKAFIIKKQ